MRGGRCLLLSNVLCSTRSSSVSYTRTLRSHHGACRRKGVAKVRTRRSSHPPLGTGWGASTRALMAPMNCLLVTFRLPLVRHKENSRLHKTLTWLCWIFRGEERKEINDIRFSLAFSCELGNRHFRLQNSVQCGENRGPHPRVTRTRKWNVHHQRRRPTWG
jgi:hypothetical protein